MSDREEDFHISDGNLSEEGQVEVNAYGSLIPPLDRAQDIVRGDEALVVRVVKSTKRISDSVVLRGSILIFCLLE